MRSNSAILSSTNTDLKEEILDLQEQLLEAQDRERYFRETINGLIQFAERLMAESIGSRAVVE